MKKTFRFTGFAGLLALGLLTFTAGTASAQSYHGQSQAYGQGPSYGQSQAYGQGPSYGQSQAYGQGPSYGYTNGYYSGPTYHPPSVHNDRVYHPTTTHWTPFRGVHTHGHYDTVPHYTPGHYDYQQGNYIQPNPNYHGH